MKKCLSRPDQNIIYGYITKAMSYTHTVAELKQVRNAQREKWEVILVYIVQNAMWA